MAIHCSQVNVWKGIMPKEITQVICLLDYITDEDVMEDQIYVLPEEWVTTWLQSSW